MSDIQRRARRRGKETERLAGTILARLFPGCKRRTDSKGQACSDLDGAPWSVEVTRSVAAGGQWEKKWKQSVRNAALEEKPPMLIFLRPRQRWQKGLVVLELGVFVELAETLRNKEVDGGEGTSQATGAA